MRATFAFMCVAWEKPAWYSVPERVVPLAPGTILTVYCGSDGVLWNACARATVSLSTMTPAMACC